MDVRRRKYRRLELTGEGFVAGKFPHEIQLQEVPAAKVLRGQDPLRRIFFGDFPEIVKASHGKISLGEFPKPPREWSTGHQKMKGEKDDPFSG